MGSNSIAHRRNLTAFESPSTMQETRMLDNLSYGPHGYSKHEESFDFDNEYHRNSGSQQLMPSRVDSPCYSKQHMSYHTGNHGSYDGWNGRPDKYGNVANGYYGGHMTQGGWSSGPNRYYDHRPGGQLPARCGPAGCHGHGYAPDRMSNNMMVSSEYESHSAVPGRMRMQNYGTNSVVYDDYPNGLHGGSQNVEWKAL